MAYRKLKRYLTGEELRRSKKLKKWKWLWGVSSSLIVISLVWKLLDMLETWIDSDWKIVLAYSLALIFIAVTGWLLFNTKKYTLKSRVKNFWG